MLTHEKRIIASAIDIGVVLIISLIINIIIPNTIYNSDITFFVAYFIIGFVYMFLCLFFSKDRTIGLYFVSLRLLSDKWTRPDMKVIIIRSLAHGVIVLHLINILYMLLNKTTDSFFDKLANSVIIKDSDAYNLINKNKDTNN